MKAIVHERYGPPDEVLRLHDIDVPPLGDDQVLVRVRAASVHADVWHVVTGWPYVLRLMGNGLLRPARLVPGTDLAGTVERVGRNVSRFGPGDNVFGGRPMMQGWVNGGTFAEYAALPQNMLVHKPAGVTFEQAASTVASGAIALVNLGPPDALAGKNVLINGAGGAMGTIAVQIAKARGARVTAVDVAEKLAMIGRLGADHAIDFTREDPTQSRERYDLVLDVASTLSLDDCRRVLTAHGIYVSIGHTSYGTVGGPLLGSIPRMLRLMVRSPFDHNLRKVNAFKMPRHEDILAELKTLLAAGTLTPIVARTFPLGEVAAAMRCLVEGRTLGKIAVTPQGP
jgi:NADPH:quinone reductase-like Zn-dependent oxidoreductase